MYALRDATVTGLKPAYDDLEPSNSCCGISLPGYDGEEDRPLDKPFIVARCHRALAAAMPLQIHMGSSMHALHVPCDGGLTKSLHAAQVAA